MVNRGLPSRRLAALVISYLRGAETALLRLTMRNTKKSDSYSASQLPDGSTASTITVVH